MDASGTEQPSQRFLPPEGGLFFSSNAVTQFTRGSQVLRMLFLINPATLIWLMSMSVAAAKRCWATFWGALAHGYRWR
jgi:hypothetical protein